MAHLLSSTTDRHSQSVCLAWLAISVSFASTYIVSEAEFAVALFLCRDFTQSATLQPFFTFIFFGPPLFQESGFAPDTCNI